jgi:peptidoglycan/LPS O-acetylase OafA/YrhL
MEKLRRGAIGAHCMLDTYRFVLALCVLQAHMLADGPTWLAAQAVFSFFVLSGFLMTLILNEDYGFEWGGFGRFAANRALRLLPIYYIVIGLTVLYLVLVGPLNQLSGAIALPRSTAEWLENLSVLGLGGFAHNAAYRLSPTAWSLAVEGFCYGLLGLYFAKSRVRLLVMLAIGVAITVIQIAGAFGEPGYGFRGHYRVIQAGFIPFAVGGLAYFFRQSQLFTFSYAKVVILCGLLVVNFLGGYLSEFHRDVSGLYVVILLNLALVPILIQRPSRHRWQKALGGMAYPFFLSHWVIGTLIAIYFPGMPVGGVLHLTVTTIITMLFSLLMYYGVDRQVQRVRALIKNGGYHDYFRRRAGPQVATVS